MLQILSFMTEKNWFQRGKYNKNKKSQKKICIFYKNVLKYI